MKQVTQIDALGKRFVIKIAHIAARTEYMQCNMSDLHLFAIDNEHGLE